MTGIKTTGEKKLMLFSGRAHPELAEEVAHQLGVGLVPTKAFDFANGEIYVRFHWDRKKKRSCRLRVAQVWSGKKWGGQIIPRVGQEAVIEFLEGDPDRPLVIGTVYNDEYKPPYELPAKKTICMPAPGISTSPFSGIMIVSA